MRETPKVKWLAAGEREERCGERPTATRKVISNIGARSPVGICQGWWISTAREAKTHSQRWRSDRIMMKRQQWRGGASVHMSSHASSLLLSANLLLSLPRCPSVFNDLPSLNWSPPLITSTSSPLYERRGLIARWQGTKASIVSNMPHTTSLAGRWCAAL